MFSHLWHLFIYQVEEVLLLTLDAIVFISDRVFSPSPLTMHFTRSLLVIGLVGAAVYFL